MIAVIEEITRILRIWGQTLVPPAITILRMWFMVGSTMKEKRPRRGRDEGIVARRTP